MPPFPLAGEFAALATSVFFSIAPTLFTISGRVLGSAVVNRSRLLAATLILMAAHFVIIGGLLPWSATPEQWFWLGLSGLIGLSLGDAALFQAFVQIGPRLTMLVFSLSPILATLFGWAWHGETLESVQLLGVAVTLGGVLWVVLEGQNGSGRIDRRLYATGLFFAFLGALGQAGGLLTAKEGLAGEIPVLSGQVIRMSMGTPGIWLVTALRGQGLATIAALRANPGATRALFAATLAGPVLGVWCSLAAVKYTPNIGVASTLQSLPPVFLIPIGYFFFKEKLSPRAIWGTVVALAGVAILFLA
ncbi:MAG: DMT family transporter [Anaerolineales bacterium]